MFPFFVSKKSIFMFVFVRYTYPHQSLSNDIWWYYIISLTFYWSLCMSQFFDVKRKDFWQMFVHHIATIVLMALSWVANMQRIGSVVLLIHDLADIFLEVRVEKDSLLERDLCVLVFREPRWPSTRGTRRSATQYLPFLLSCGLSQGWGCSRSGSLKGECHVLFNLANVQF